MADGAQGTEKPQDFDGTDGFEPLRRAVLIKALELAPFEGWTLAAFEKAGMEAGAGKPALHAAFPGGVRDLIGLWSEAADAEMLGAMKTPAFSGLKIREKVAFAVRARLDALRPHKEASRRAAAYLALPTSGFLGATLAWKTADAIWRGLGDTSTDFNFYSKRGVLTGVWTSTFMRWLADDSKDEAATNAFLDARIENVMQFEKAKAQARKLGLDPAKPIEWLAKLRYRPSHSETAHREEKVDEALEESFPASDPPYWTSGMSKE